MTAAPPSSIYLASKSPRRQALLQQLGVAFEVLLMREAPGRAADVVEIAADGEPPRHYVERIARTKASVGWERVVKRGMTLRPVLGADTEVVLDDLLFGKPADAAQAADMLARLAGRTHSVLTGVAVHWHDETVFALSESRVTFRELSRSEIKHYVATGEPTDKAGGYAIQGRAAAFIERLEGSYSGVMGLPLFETAAALARVGVSVL
jgi:septum formation protein